MRLEADANVLLSAVLGGRARLVVESSEVQEYAIQLAKKKRLSVDVVLLTVATLPVTVVERTVSASSIPEANRRIGQRDPDDVELLALALHLDLPIWSNDSDFEVAGVEWHTTAELLKKLRILRW